MGNWIGGVLVVGNELSKVDTLKSLAKTALNSGEMVGEIIGSGVLANAEGLADKVYTETVEMLALYLATLVDGDTEDEDEDDGCDDGCDDEDDDEDDSEGEDEDDEPTCVRCGEVGADGDWLDCEYVCYGCMNATEYRNL